MRLATERRMAQNVGSQLGLPGSNHTSKNILLETLTGQDQTLDFGDYLNLEKNRPINIGAGNDANIGVHTSMEQKLGL